MGKKFGVEQNIYKEEVSEICGYLRGYHLLRPFVTPLITFEKTCLTVVSIGGSIYLF